jgi:hypothetical protein
VSTWTRVEAGIAEREAVLLSVRDLVVLIVVVAMILWIAFEIRRKGGP